MVAALMFVVVMTKVELTLIPVDQSSTAREMEVFAGHLGPTNRSLQMVVPFAMVMMKVELTLIPVDQSSTAREMEVFGGHLGPANQNLQMVVPEYHY